MAGQKPLVDIPRAERYAGWPALEELFADVSPRDQGVRNAGIPQAYLEHGYTKKEIGDFLGLHYTTISVIVRQAEQRTLQFKTPI